jgi:hypothetical protein
MKPFVASDWIETSVPRVFGVTVLFPFAPPSSANTNSFEMCV